MTLAFKLAPQPYNGRMIAFECGQGPVSRLVFSPDGTSLASSAGKGILHLWEHGTPRWQKQLPVYSYAISFSPTLPLVTFGGMDSLVVDDSSGATFYLDTGEIHSTLPRLATQIIFLSFVESGDKMLIASTTASGYDDRMFGARNLDRDKIPRCGGISLWPFPVPQNKPNHIFETSGVRAFDFSMRSGRFAWLADSRRLRTSTLSKQDVFDIPLRSPGGRLRISEAGMIAVACGWEIHVFSADSRNQRYTLKGHKGNVTDLAFAPDGRTLLSGSWDETVKLWDIEAGTEKASFAWKMGRITSVAVAPDGLRYACGADNGTILMWDAE